jgi:nitrogen fixation protein FixH
MTTKKLRQFISRPVFYLSLIVILLLSSVLAHNTVVYGTLSVTPQQPIPGKPFVLRISLRDPNQIPVEDARVKAEATHPDDIKGITTANFKEVAPGDYETTLTLPREGTWQLRLRDQTYEYEETGAVISLELGTTENQLANFEFPKTTPPRAFNVWLMVAIVAPILFGAVVTVRVLTTKIAVPSEA